MRISRFSFALVGISLLLASPMRARDEGEREKAPKAPLLMGVAVQVDLAGPVMKALNTKFDQLECGARINFRDKYFPLVELGVGECERDGEQNANHFKTRAPYFRVGMDYNFNKKHNGNRFFAGLRYGFSGYTYDFTNVDFQDPVYGGNTGLDLSGQKANMHWAEASVGCETKLWSFIRLGWTLRFKARISEKDTPYGSPYYVPGFGKNGSTTWGGTCNLIFDIGKKFNTQETKK